ncbi:pimeloyl-ACP methyl ester carboxylesterase [Microbacterium resistens]|uniref:Pimeloyl-ACP methyl ester carboxylesterase n=1 Tax=Microbacterium resistens TaxID=156977 RepID=A0ABU1S982_9MICO|nr:alpha/beta hydrolase [Microbacterium resistens]MDR6866177.1 pimeloyl-ACP methyl ester carboxylesterase [Microbacterium resistens]
MSDFHELTVPGDCPLSVRDYGGSGPGVLLLHGAGRNLEDWTPFAENLVADHRVVSMDFRNHGRSGSGPWTWEAVLADVDRVIVATGLIAPALVGHSLGGMVGALYAVRGGSVSGVVNLDGYGSGTPDQYVGLDPVVVQEHLRTIQEAAPMGSPDAAGPLTPDGVSAIVQAHLSQASVLGLPVALELAGVGRSLQDGPDGGLVVQPSAEDIRELVAALVEVDWMDDVFGRIESPFLIYRCEALDGVEGEALAFMEAYALGLRRDLDEISARAANVTVRYLDAHHGLVLTMPEVLAEDTRAFIAAIDARTPVPVH